MPQSSRSPAYQLLGLWSSDIDGGGVVWGPSRKEDHPALLLSLPAVFVRPEPREMSLHVFVCWVGIHTGNKNFGFQLPMKCMELQVTFFKCR